MQITNANAHKKDPTEKIKDLKKEIGYWTDCDALAFLCSILLNF